MSVRVRLAPSPTGTLHIGTARTALFNWLFAKRTKGKFLLRIEDTDKERSKPEFTHNIFEGLKWLGLNWDEDPVIQSKCLQAHRAAIQLLLDKGLAYRCYVNESELDELRSDQKKQGKAPRYDNRHRNLSLQEEDNFINEGRTSVIRFRIEDNQSINWNDLVRGQMQWNSSDLGGDMVISRRAYGKEIGDPLYNLVVVVDDSTMGITHVIRGEDHLANTAKQLLLYQALNLPIPEFAHTPLILNAEGRKLSKRDGVISLNDFREMGYTSEAMANYMTLLGWSVPEGMSERFTLSEASKQFSFDRVNKAGAKFDWDKLNWLNSQSIHELSPESLLENLKPLWLKEGWESPDYEWSKDLTELIGPSLIVLKDGVDQARPFFEEPSMKADGVKQLEVEGAKKVLKKLIEKLEKSPFQKFDNAQAKALLKEIAELEGFKQGLIMKSLRAALLGTMKGPDLITTWGLLARVGQDLPRLRRVF